jgi:hypothetical protein
VRAFDSAGNRSSPSERTCGRTGEPGVPGSPLELRAEAASASAVSLRWEPGEDGVVHRVYSNDRVVGSTTGLSFVDSGLRPEARYCYRVVAVGASGKESPAQPPVCITTASPPAAAR